MLDLESSFWPEEPGNSRKQAVDSALCMFTRMSVSTQKSRGRGNTYPEGGR